MFTYTITVNSPNIEESAQNIIDQLAATIAAKYQLTPSPTTTGVISSIEIVVG
jgi:hypothetical protein